MGGKGELKVNIATLINLLNALGVSNTMIIEPKHWDLSIYCFVTTKFAA
jgi:hypothetical protein